MLTELCAELKNYFLRDREADIHDGEYTISGGSIDLPFLLNGQYFRIVGSVLNDGVYQYPADGLTDEEFTGAVWAMAVPPAVIALAADIEAWNENNAEALASPYTSESFGGYSYTKATTGGVGTSCAFTWRDQFASRLAKWRRLSVL
jgi:hypothetical protein